MWFCCELLKAAGFCFEGGCIVIMDGAIFIWFVEAINSVCKVCVKMFGWQALGEMEAHYHIQIQGRLEQCVLAGQLSTISWSCL